MALDVFQRVTVPRFSDLAARTYPGLDQLHPDATGAIVSLVYNRGASLTGDHRREMAAIKPLVVARDYQGIASQIRAMQRLWPDVPGLLLRREAEAGLVEDCNF
jgi:GH24 family phage-related lysozyme (muramidase)